MFSFVAIIGSNEDDLVKNSIGNMLNDSIGVVPLNSLDRKLNSELKITGSRILDVTEFIELGSCYKDIMPLEERYGSSIYLVVDGYINLRYKFIGIKFNKRKGHDIDDYLDFPHLEISQMENNSTALKPEYIH